MPLSTDLTRAAREALELEARMERIRMCAVWVVNAQLSIDLDEEPQRPLPDLIRQLGEAIER